MVVLRAQQRYSAALALILVLAMPVSQMIVSAVVHGIVECCCGTHDADHDCGCPDCPGGKRGKQHHAGSSTPSFEPCGSQGHLTTAAVFPDFISPDLMEIREELQPLRGRPENHPLPPSPVLDRPTDPPEASCQSPA